MNIFLLSLIDKRIEGAMIRFSQLPVRSSLLSSNYHELLVKLTKNVIDTYIRFFQCVYIVPKEYGYRQNMMVKRFDLSDVSREKLKGIEKMLIDLIPVPVCTSVIPVNLRIHQSGQIFLYTGIGIFESTLRYVVFSLYELSIPMASIQYSPGVLQYLETVLYQVNNDEPSKSKPLRKLAADYGKNYNQFQKDCKDYFGDTFHQFHNKMKMLNVLEDILFTAYSLKEIAYRNDFSNYNSMYFLFGRKYGFPLYSIPRLLTEI
ncbi:helix-turn-helix domain-containing protein [Chryseobacterium sp. MEBOG07]|uniref:helix-turn-helix domain-containing protein n=1 Tax=Chryseobacterium sp. MEBOG07 TaxID=2879939 RepID=UPI001F17CF81|nr:helix-turn-helix domain-containing protein [Chryseobacterium sp. MEBOG07]UKB78597.1 helix-turn-helix domain-containing protein [Chryseobacterium sp. MEBOG07]